MKGSLHLKLINGFTLIELMVVLAIMGTAFALVGPNIMKSYDKIKVQTDIVDLNETLKKISYKAFINGRKVIVKFSADKIAYQYVGNFEIHYKNYSFIRFTTQELKFTEAGFTDSTHIDVLIANEKIKISLKDVNTL